jgi:hypothetical protein
MRVKLLENIYEMVCESRWMYGAEMWGSEERWKEADIFQVRFCKKTFKDTYNRSEWGY